MHREKGFTLIELLIVVSILLIIAAIAILRLLRSRMSAEEASAIASLRTISTAEAQVLAQGEFTDPVTGISLYASLEQLGTLNPPPLDSVLTGGDHIKSGYQFEIDLTTQTSESADYSAYGIVLRQGTDVRNFFIDPSGVIHYTNDGSTPNSTSQTL